MSYASQSLDSQSGAKKSPVPHAIIGEFSSAAKLFVAAEKTRDRGFKKWDVFSPCPIHGMDEAMGIRRSIVSWIVLAGGATGFITATLLEFIPSTITYPLIVQGKPLNFFTLPAFFPIMFELTVLFGSFAAIFGMLFVNRLPRWNHPLFEWDRFAKVTDDGFFLAIEGQDPQFREGEVREFLTSLGATNVTLIHEN